MRQLQIGDRVLRDTDCFVIAELGCNFSTKKDETREQQLAECKWLIEKAAKCGADAVKFQKRNNKAMFTKTAYNAPYVNERSHGATYGEHREHNDWFGINEWVELKATAKREGVLFFATPFEEESALFLNTLDVPMFKIASCDVTNIPLVRFVASMQKPVLMSIGGVGTGEYTMDDVKRATDVMDEINPNYAVLYCVSTYPNRDEDLFLENIVELRTIYRDKLIGFSSHHTGIEPLVVGTSLGANIFEVHFTRNRGALGPDHGFSMEPQGLERICEDLPRVPKMIGIGVPPRDPRKKQAGFVSKMGKGVYLVKGLRAGDTIREIDIVIKSPAGDGLKPGEVGEAVGSVLKENCSTGVCLKSEMFVNCGKLT